MRERESETERDRDSEREEGVGGGSFDLNVPSTTPGHSGRTNIILNNDKYK